MILRKDKGIELILPRYDGNGNTFLIWDLGVFDIIEDERAFWARKLCQGYPGFKTDGLIFLRQIRQDYWEWDFRNSDGSQATFCGNAARVVAAYVGGNVQLQTAIGTVSVGWEPDKKRYFAQWSWHDGAHFISEPLCALNTGTPHWVVPGFPSREKALEVRSQDSVFQGQTNVTFVRYKGKGHIQSVTFEKGVEDFTLSCGTGAVAASWYARHFWHPDVSTWKVTTGAGPLFVDFSANQQVKLSGAVNFHFEIKIRDSW